ncbi:hypothetical protein [Acinetobacter sp. YK3]|uniref:hypothetical protein n=1 Tax=Acinetobacter sp. YK3 TaxID=1860097 RepID=UPI00084C3315|nr:hypothetical protein [Acinetobacter sp. YK3]OEC91682.1 hypothetical protein A9Z07_16555 [Acinetobacter sp. YK3]
MPKTIFENHNAEENYISNHFKSAFLCFLYSFIILLVFSSLHQAALHQVDLARNHTWKISKQYVNSTNQFHIRRERAGASLILPTNANNSLTMKCDVKLMKLCQQELKKPTHAIQTIYYYQTIPIGNNRPEYQLKAIDYIDLKGNLIHLNYQQLAPNTPTAIQKKNWKLWIITFIGAWMFLLIAFMVSTLLKIFSNKSRIILMALLSLYYILAVYSSVMIYIS